MKPQTVQIVRQGEATPYWFKFNPLYQQGSQPILPNAVKRQAAQKVGEMFDLFVARHDGAFEDADFVFGAQ